MYIITNLRNIPADALRVIALGNSQWRVFVTGDSTPEDLWPLTQAEKDAILAKLRQDELDARAAKAYPKLQALLSMTPAQIQAWVVANVTNLAQAQDAISTLATAVGVLARRL
jgi:hypothetical protein